MALFQHFFCTEGRGLIERRPGIGRIAPHCSQDAESSSEGSLRRIHQTLEMNDLFIRAEIHREGFLGSSPLNNMDFQILKTPLEGRGDDGVEAHDAHISNSKLVDEGYFDGTGRAVLLHKFGADGVEVLSILPANGEFCGV